MTAGLTQDVPRSYLYVPGNAPDKLAKALGRGADALIVDLEDAVPVAHKESALAAVVAWLREQPTTGPVALWVRVNSGDLRARDVRALAGIPSLTGLALAKAEGPADVAAVAALLDEVGDSTTLVMPLIETAAALLDVATIARQPRVIQLQIGEVDLTGETGISPGPDEVELVAMRTMVVLASVAAGIAPPVGPVSRITDDLDELSRSTHRVARLGFVGRACIHPRQLDVVHEVFTPSAAAVADARESVRLLADAESRGTGVVLDAQGRLVDPAVLHAAHRVLALHERAARIPQSNR